jgi:hypothetical protein
LHKGSFKDNLQIGRRGWNVQIAAYHAILECLIVSIWVVIVIDGLATIDVVVAVIWRRVEGTITFRTG